MKYPSEPNAKAKKVHEVFHLNFNSLFHNGMLPEVNPYHTLYQLGGTSIKIDNNVIWYCGQIQFNKPHGIGISIDSKG